MKKNSRPLFDVRGELLDRTRVFQFLTCYTRWTEVFMICGFEVPSWPRPVLAILKRKHYLA